MEGNRSSLRVVRASAKEEARAHEEQLQRRDRGVQFGPKAVLQYSDTPSLRSQGIEDEDDDEYENEAHHELEGWIFTSLGVLCFSLSFVGVRLALRGFDPLFIALARGAGAGIIACGCALLGKYPLPSGSQVLRLCLAAAGIVFAFPILTTIALQSVPASHAATVSAIMPLLTAVFGVWRKREHVPIAFWAIAAGGTLVVVWFSISRSGGLQLSQADLLIMVASVACAYGYAEGGLLAHEMGGWRAICWMLVLAAPVALVSFSTYLLARGPLHSVDSPSAWFGLLYQVLVSQFLGFALYYRGLGRGGVARMSQIQQFQSVLAVLAASLFLGEQIDLQLWVVVGLLLVAVVAARWATGRAGRGGMIRQPPEQMTDDKWLRR
jgi:drug/metabolite transporter (DMT)-like permease